MKKTIIVTHGNFGKELLKSIEMIIGKQFNTVTLSLLEGDEIETLKSKISKEVDLNKKTFIFVDLYGGTPFNLSLDYLQRRDVFLITGVNLPMLLEYYTKENITIEELIIISKDSIKYANKELELL